MESAVRRETDIRGAGEGGGAQGAGRDLEAGEVLHEELSLAGVLREEADVGADVDAPDCDLEDRDGAALPVLATVGQFRIPRRRR